MAPGAEVELNDETHSSNEAHDDTTSGLTTFNEPTATNSPRDCFNDYRSCLQTASTFEGKIDCRSRFRSCLGPPGAEVELNDETHSSNEAQYDTTTTSTLTLKDTVYVETS